MNILITGPSLTNVSGVTTLVNTIIKRSKNENRFFHFRLGKIDNQKKRLNWAFDQLNILPRLLKMIRKHRIDLVHLNAPFEKDAVIRDYVVFYVSKYILKKKVVLHIHGGYLLMNPPAPGSVFAYMIKKMFTDADVKIVLSELERQAILKSYNINCIALPNAIDNMPGTMPPKTFQGKLNFIFLGRLVESKGVFLIVDVFRELESYFGSFHFDIYGNGPDMNKFLELLSDMKGLSYTYKGVARGDEKWDALKAADVFLLPSLHGEGLPVALLEAMRCGCIPVVSDDASMPDVVRHNYDGFIVDKGSKEDLKSTLLNILENRNRLPAMSNAASETILEKYSIDTYLAQLNQLYTSIGSYPQQSKQIPSKKEEQLSA
jgi:glycosyltransferase involved in cell wall biosynthesis